LNLVTGGRKRKSFREQERRSLRTTLKVRGIEGSEETGRGGGEICIGKDQGYGKLVVRVTASI